VRSTSICLSRSLGMIGSPQPPLLRPLPIPALGFNGSFTSGSKPLITRARTVNPRGEFGIGTENSSASRGYQPPAGTLGDLKPRTRILSATGLALKTLEHEAFPLHRLPATGSRERCCSAPRTPVHNAGAARKATRSPNRSEAVSIQAKTSGWLSSLDEAVDAALLSLKMASSAGPYGLQNFPPVTSSISTTLMDRPHTARIGLNASRVLSRSHAARGGTTARRSSI
jgi:hypothetical protein